MSAVSRTTRPAGHVLVVNPNSDPEVTGRLRDAARRALPSGIRAEVANPAGGPFAIETDSQKAEAVPRVLDLVRERGFGRFGAIAMGCFDDLALEELRRLAPVPVVGTFEAGLLHVRSLSSRFAIVTTFEAALPGIAGLLRRYGAPDCVGIRAAGVGVALAITDDELLTRLTWRYMQWFFGQMDTLFVPSQCYLKRLAENGFRPEKMRVLRRGVDTALFHPSRRDENYWNQRGVGPGLKFLYVGRLSPEKGLEPLLEGFERLLQQGQSAQLILVGDGPQRDALSQRFYQPEITFTGFLSGAELATAYASADAFVFPSRTDTFGNVVLEAQASGLPMLVTAEGGPAETVQAEQSGWLVEGNDATAWEKALLRVCQSSAEFRTLGQRAAAHAHHHSWDSVFADFWRTPTELPLDHALPHPLESLASLVF